MDRSVYAEKMRHCRPFQYFGIQPEWRPGEGDIWGFCHDEVIRQFHDPRVKDDGGVRVQWMFAAWSWAQNISPKRAPLPTDIQALGQLVEPKVNTGGFRDVDVFIGEGKGAPPNLIPRMVNDLALRAKRVTPTQKRGTDSVHANAYRALWQYNILTDGDILNSFYSFTQTISTPDDWYLAYEAVHPFRDGNGRTGKILYNWLLETLDEPVLVDDYFGGGNP